MSTGTVDEQKPDEPDECWCGEEDCPCLCLDSTITLGAGTRIFRMENPLASILGFSSMSELLGSKIHSVLPNVDLSVEGTAQFVCAVSLRKNCVPMRVTVIVEKDDETGTVCSYELRVCAFSALTAEVEMDIDGVIVDHPKPLDKLLGYGEFNVITDVFPQFYVDIHEPMKKDSQMNSPRSTSSETSFTGTHNCHNADNKCVHEGSFFALLHHRDGHSIAVRIRISSSSRPGCSHHLSICYDRRDEFAHAAALPNTTHDHAQAMDAEERECVRGEYSEYYDTFDLIGHGSFGSVKLSRRKSDGEETVTKFILKQKVLAESWIKVEGRDGMYPIEIHLLETLRHPNIVKLLDVFENHSFYCMVMDRRPGGMDLFEFTEQQPKMGEDLMAHIFGQVVCAVSYLHSAGYVHRDIKDENVLIDANFHCRLIDFGSAARFGDDVVFSTFCGTMAFASPEVLQGNKYRGPEQDIWALGFLLYTIVYNEVPFRTARETMRCELDFPRSVSEGLYQLLSILLSPQPNDRLSIEELEQHWWLRQPCRVHDHDFWKVVGRRSPIQTTKSEGHSCAADFESHIITKGMSEIEIGNSV